MGSEASHIRAGGVAADRPADGSTNGSTNGSTLRAALAQVPAVSSALVDVNALAQTRRLPVAEGLHSLFDGRAGSAGIGLTRGTSVGVSGAQGSVSLALALVAEAMRAGSWVAVVDAPWLGLAALEQYGIDLHRLVMVNQTGVSSGRPASGNTASGNTASGNAASQQWASVMAALVDGFEVVIHTSRSVGERDARRVRAHAREKEAVLMQVGSVRAGGIADLQLDVVGSTWSGIGDGHGHLVSRLVDVEVSGRRLGGRPRRTSLWLPDEQGVVRAFDPTLDRRDGDAVIWAGSDIDGLLDHDPNTPGVPGTPILRSVR